PRLSQDAFIRVTATVESCSATGGCIHCCAPYAMKARGVGHGMHNRVLDALPEVDCARLKPDLELVQLPLGTAVYESGGAQRYLYFPRSAIVSLLYVLEDGASAELAVVGNDGV